MKKILYSGILCSAILFGCSSSSSDDLSSPNPNPNPDPSAKITYNANIKSIMTSHCTSCHGSPTTQSAPFPLTTYTQVKDKVDIILTRINSATNPMPASGQIPLATRQLVQQWKDDGLLEN